MIYTKGEWQNTVETRWILDKFFYDEKKKKKRKLSCPSGLISYGADDFVCWVFV